MCYMAFSKGQGKVEKSMNFSTLSDSVGICINSGVGDDRKTRVKLSDNIFEDSDLTAMS